MIYGFVYIAAFIILVNNVMLYPKNETKKMLLSEASLAVVAVLCFSVIVAYIYTIAEIPVNIKTLSIAYFILAILLTALIIRKKTLQKLYIDKWQIFSVVMFTVVLVVVERKTFTFDFRPSFLNFHDASAHFEMAMSIVRNESLGGMPFAPLYNATVIEILLPLFPKSVIYKPFIVAEALHYYFEMIFFYSLTLNINKKKTTKYIAIIVTLVYWMGYPLYSYAIGNYVYWSWGVILFGYTIYLVKGVLEDKGTVFEYVGIILGIFGVMQCYMLFTPFLILSIAVLTAPRIYSQLRNNKKLCMALITAILFLGIIAMFTIKTYFGNVSGIFNSLNIPGDTYLNLIGNFLLVIPIAISFSWYLKENESSSIYLSVFVCNILCLIPLLVLVKAGLMSDYYYSKLYYVIWIFAWLMTLDALDKIKVEEAAVKYVKSYVIFVVVILASCFLRINKLVPDSLLSTDKYLPGTSLFSFNLDFLDEDYEEYIISAFRRL